MHMLDNSWPHCKRHFPCVASSDGVSLCLISIISVSGLHASDNVLGTLFVCSMMPGQTFVVLRRWATDEPIINHGPVSTAGLGVEQFLLLRYSVCLSPVLLKIGPALVILPFFIFARFP